MRFEVAADRNKFEWNELGVTGTLRIELNGKPFPKKPWKGSVSETLIMWGESLLSLLDPSSNRTEEFFFPGSVSSFIVTKSMSFVNIELLESAGSAGGTVCEVTLNRFVGAMYTVIGGLISDERLKDVRQVKRLKSIAERVKNAAETHGCMIG